MTRRLDHALGVLSALDSGRAAPRPARPTFEVMRKRASQSLCKLCNHQVTFASTPSGHRMPLDRAPDGDLVIIAGTVREYGPLYLGHLRYVRHVGQACRDAQGV